MAKFRDFTPPSDNQRVWMVPVKLEYGDYTNQVCPFRKTEGDGDYIRLGGRDCLKCHYHVGRCFESPILLCAYPSDKFDTVVPSVEELNAIKKAKFEARKAYAREHGIRILGSKEDIEQRKKGFERFD